MRKKMIAAYLLVNLAAVFVLTGLAGAQTPAPSIPEPIDQLNQTAGANVGKLFVLLGGAAALVVGIGLAIWGINKAVAVVQAKRTAKAT